MNLFLLPNFAHALLYQEKGPGMLRKTKLRLRPRRNEMRNGRGKEKDANTYAALTMPDTVLRA